MKPKNVRNMKAMERIVCCCISCENIKLTYRALSKQILTERLPTDPDEIAKWIMCDFGEMAKPDCTFRMCVNNGLKKVDELKKETGSTEKSNKYEQ